MAKCDRSRGCVWGAVQRSEEREGPTGPNQTTTVVWAPGAGQGSKPSGLECLSLGYTVYI